MSAALNFNASAVEPDTGFDPIPAGDYPVIITDSELKQTKAGTGHYLQCTLQVIDGPFANRLLWHRLNIQNPNKTAEDIGQRQLSALCRAVGKMQVADSAELHGIPFIARVVVKADDYYGNSNEVKSVKAMQAAGQPQAQPAFQAPPQPAPAQQAPQQQSAPAGTPPWQAAAA